MDAPSGDQAATRSGRSRGVDVMTGRIGVLLLWTLAAASIVLLAYQGWTLIGSVLAPLVANPQALQTDFHYYYEAARRFATGSLLYSLTDDAIAGFTYPPPAIVPFLWLARWPLGTALTALTILSYLLLAVTVQQWVAFLRRHGFAPSARTVLAIGLVAFAFGPTYMNAIFGQVNVFVLASAVGFITLAEALPVTAALLLAVGAWLKVYPGLLIAVGAWDRTTWRALAWSAAALFAIGIGALAIVPLRDYWLFVAEVLPARVDKTAIHITNQSLVAFIERFRYPSAQFLNWTGEQAVTVGAATRLFNVAVAGAAMVYLARRARQGPRALAMSAATLMALIAVIAPLGWGHTYVMVLPLAIAQLIAMRDAKPIAALAIFLSVAVMMIPAGRRFGLVEGAPDVVLNLFYSRYLFATLVLAAIPTDQRGRGSAATFAASA